MDEGDYVRWDEGKKRQRTPPPGRGRCKGRNAAWAQTIASGSLESPCSIWVGVGKAAVDMSKNDKRVKVMHLARMHPQRAREI